MAKEKRKKAEAVIFRKRKAKPEFLIMHRKLHWRGWEIVKGTVESNENLEHALKREIFEETGYKKTKILKALGKKQKYFDKVHDCAVESTGFVVMSLETKRARLDRKTKEHSGYKWVDAKTAMKLLKWPEQKNFFRAALKFLGEKND